jgi:hypothetical protein
MAEQFEDFVEVGDLETRYPGFKASWWYANAEAGRVPSYKIGKYRKFKLSEIVKWFEAQRQGPATPR